MDRQYSRKLWWQIIVTTLMFAVIPLFTLGVVIYQQFSASYTGKITESLKTLAENRKGAIDLFFEERVAQLMTLAYTESLAQLQDENYLNKVFKIIQARSRSYLDLGVIDQDGNHLAYVGPYYSLLKPVNYKNEDWFKAVMKVGFHVSDVFLGFRKVPHFTIAVLVREGDRTWILRATIDSEILENIVRAAQIGKKGDAFIINRDNVLQTEPRLSGNLLGPPKTPDFSKYVGLSVEEISYGGEKTLFATTVLKNNSWVLVIKEDPAEQFSPLFRARDIAALIFLGGVLVIVVGAVLTTRWMMNELAEMERKKAISDDLVIQSSKMAALGKMATGIAHEINNPLAVIGEKAGWVKDLLEKEDLAQSKNLQEFADAVHKIELHVGRAKKVIHRLLGFARRMEPLIEKVDVNQVLEESVDSLENEARYRNIEIVKDLTPDLLHISSDSSQLHQVFLNILNNAIDAIDKDGKIELRTKYIGQDHQIAVEIQDSGPGIPKEILDKIFDPFFTTKEVGKGTGVGLSISYNIMEKLGGRIMVASEPGKGTTFTLYLPVI
jgi:two-component system NtrC family sensor kinase